MCESKSARMVIVDESVSDSDVLRFKRLAVERGLEIVAIPTKFSRIIYKKYCVSLQSRVEKVMEQWNPKLQIEVIAKQSRRRYVCQVLNTITSEQLLDEKAGLRGGLHKLEPKELANVDASAIEELLPGFERGLELTQPDMFVEGELAA